MDCTRFHDRLEALLDGTLSAATRRGAEAHAAVCERCGELYALMRVDLDSSTVETPDGLAESILARTSGPSCGRALPLLTEHVDSALDEPDRELLVAHLDTCTDCATMATALGRLSDDLPAFAELRPDSSLIRDVLARTRPRQSRWSTGWGRIRTAGHHLAGRPRIAWEAGYVAAMLVWLVFGATWSPLRAAPVQALALIQQGAAETQSAGASAMSALSRGVATIGERAVGIASSGASNVTRGFLTGLSVRYQRAANAAPDLGQHWRQLTAAVLDRDLFSGVDALRSLTRDAGVMLNRLLVSPTTTTDSRSIPAQRSAP